MEASKVTINPDKLKYEQMTEKQRTELRARNIIDLIRNTPAGERITLMQFMKAAGYRTYQSADSKLKSMIRQGLISKTELDHPKTYAYSINDGTLTAPKREPAKEVQHFDDIQPPFQTLGDYAKQFVWEANSDSLRDFVRWMDGKELDLRRMLSGGF
jgi:hypothetical protein